MPGDFQIASDPSPAHNTRASQCLSSLRYNIIQRRYHLQTGDSNITISLKFPFHRGSRSLALSASTARAAAHRTLTSADFPHPPRIYTHPPSAYPSSHVQPAATTTLSLPEREREHVYQQQQQQQGRAARSLAAKEGTAAPTLLAPRDPRVLYTEREGRRERRWGSSAQHTNTQIEPPHRDTRLGRVQSGLHDGGKTSDGEGGGQR